MTAPLALPPAANGTGPPAGTEYAGLATRTLAFAIDAAVINGVAWFVGIVVALGLSLLEVPDAVTVVLAAIGALLALVWMVVYFAFFWSASGQTLGNRVMRIRVEDPRTGAPIRTRRAVVRVAALLLSALPLCAGFLLILVDSRRRALHDRLVRTQVVYLPEAARRREGRAPAYQHAPGRAADGVTPRIPPSASTARRSR